MSSKDTAFHVHPALGGWDISSDPTILDPNFLTVADNIEYLEGGQRKKRGGTYIYSTGVTSTGTGTFLTTGIRALADHWRYAGTLTPTQVQYAVAGQSIYKSTGDGKWTAMTATSSFGVANSAKTTFVLAGDYAVLNDALGTTTPVALDQTNILNFTSSGMTAPPIYTGAAYHLNRLFYGGLSTQPSQVNVTAANNIFDSTGADTTNFLVNSGDGDQVMGISNTFYGSVYIFKGPQFGSVYQLSGNTLATFSLSKVAHGAPLLNPKALVTTPTDIYWMSNYGVHSLQTTVKFGNVEQAFLSLPIQKLFRNGLLKGTALNQAWGFWNPMRNIVGWAVVPAGQTKLLWVLVYNYALSDPKPGGKKFWSRYILPYSALCGQIIINPSPTGWNTNHQGDPHLWYGTHEGQAYSADTDTVDAELNDGGLAYTATVATPTITRYPTPQRPAYETQEKSHTGVVTYLNPKGNYSANLAITIDRRLQNQTVSMAGGGDVLDISFILDTSIMGGLDFNYTENTVEDRGRSISLQWSQSGLNQDMELFGYSVRYYPAEEQAKEPS